jgi:hypothetical protein
MARQYVWSAEDMGRGFRSTEVLYDVETPVFMTQQRPLGFIPDRCTCTPHQQYAEGVAERQASTAT